MAIDCTLNNQHKVVQLNRFNITEEKSKQTKQESYTSKAKCYFKCTVTVNCFTNKSRHEFAKIDEIWLSEKGILLTL